jgi:hypothetical protein
MGRRRDDVAGWVASSTVAKNSRISLHAGLLSRAHLPLIVTGSSVGSLTPLFRTTGHALMGYSSMTGVCSHR